jgi:hypothetical protein
MDLYAVTYWLKAPKLDGTTSLIRLTTWIVVSQNLKGFDVFGYKSFYQEMANWLSIMMVWLSCKMIAHRMTVGMSLRWESTERKPASTEHQRASAQRQRCECDPFDNQRVASSRQSTEELLAGVRFKTASDMLVAPTEKCASMEYHRFLGLHLG